MGNSLICNNCGVPYESESNGETLSSGVILHRYSKNQSSHGWVCTACGAYHPIMDSEEEGERLYQAFQRLRESDFEGAKGAFEAFLQRYPENAEALWGKLRAKYRVTYVQDENGKMVPVCGAPNAKSIFKNEDYLRALQYADEEYKAFLTAQAEYIEQSRLAERVKRRRCTAGCLTAVFLLTVLFDAYIFYAIRSEQVTRSGYRMNDTYSSYLYAPVQTDSNIFLMPAVVEFGEAIQITEVADQPVYFVSSDQFSMPVECFYVVLNSVHAIERVDTSFDWLNCGLRNDGFGIWKIIPTPYSGVLMDSNDDNQKQRKSTGEEQ